MRVYIIGSGKLANAILSSEGFLESSTITEMATEIRRFK
jgi:hypothetical protein